MTIQILAFVRPFDVATWSLILATLVVSVLFILLVGWFHADSTGPKFTTGSSVLYVMAVAMMESHGHTFQLTGGVIRGGVSAFLLGLFVISKVKVTDTLGTIEVFLALTCCPYRSYTFRPTVVRWYRFSLFR